MRISDWSSDVCSSDLLDDDAGAERLAGQDVGVEALRPLQPYTRSAAGRPRQELRQVALQPRPHGLPARPEVALQAVDRKSVGEGKSVSARVDTGCHRLIKKTKT